MARQLLALAAGRGDPASLVAFVLAFPTAIVAARLATRTRFFEGRENLPKSWHGRSPNNADRETDDGYNPVFVFFAAFLGSMLVYLATIEVLFAG